MYNITIIGAGQIGSRHLQALAKLDSQKYSITVVDPDTNSLVIAEQRFNEVVDQEFNISYFTSISELPKNIDVAIIASGSSVRRKITEELLADRKVNYIVFEKFLFQAEDDYSKIAELLIAKNTLAFVNCTRRMWTIYKDIKSMISGPITFSVIGNNWSLGSNGIHLLDLFSYLINDEPVDVGGIHLDTDVKESKRPGYVDFTGTLSGKTKTGSIFSATSYDEERSPVTIMISDSKARIIVREDGAKAKLMHSTLENGWQWEEKNYDVQFQSVLSNIFVEELINTKNCELVSYEASSKLHLSLLRIFLNLVNNVEDKKVTQCLIT